MSSLPLRDETKVEVELNKTFGRRQQIVILTKRTVEFFEALIGFNEIKTGICVPLLIINKESFIAAPKSGPPQRKTPRQKFSL